MANCSFELEPKDHFEGKIGAQNLFFGLPKQFHTDLNRFKENVPVAEVKSKAYQVNTYQRRFKLKNTVPVGKLSLYYCQDKELVSFDCQM